jgi:hypothetical protein
MKEYPKILGPYDAPWGQECVAFDKLDGSNIRFEWNPKQGWYKFGTRRRMFDKNDPEYGICIDMFLKKYGDAVPKIILDKNPKIESILAYAEFFGPFSFGGKHDNQWLSEAGLLPAGQNNDKKDIVLFDVNPYKKGFISPVQFLKLFSSLDIPRVVYQGKLTQEFAESIRQDETKHHIQQFREGVVVKGGERHKLWMRKVKTFSYLKKIKEVFGTGWEAYWES